MLRCSRGRAGNLSKHCVKMATRTPEKSKWKRRKSPKLTEDDNDCASLAWLLNFRLDDLLKIKVPEPDEEPKIKEAKMCIPDIPPEPRKPPYTYPELIEWALREKGELTVSAIYQWISDHFPFYRASDERWKNSVRHNLSINPHFHKGARAPQGAGHLWSLAPNAIDLLPQRRYEDASTEEYETVTEEYVVEECPKVIVLDEAAIAAASIVPDHDTFMTSTAFMNPVSAEQIVRECGLVPIMSSNSCHELII